LAEGDVLYIGDGDDFIKWFDAETGAFRGASDGPEVSGLAGPRGIVVDGDELLVVNQNVNRDVSGEVLRYSAETGSFLGALVPFSDPNAPFAPDGIVIAGNGDLCVGSLLRKPNLGPAGRVMQYASDGVFLGDAKVKNNEHHPRGVVFGPDGLLYVSTRDLKNGLGGTILRYGADGKADVFIDDKGGFGQLNRPDGLVFGPDGSLYVTSFRAGPGDTDSIRIYDPQGNFTGKIDLHDGAPDSRVYAQSLLFGPGGQLFVPLNNTGQVRRYHSATADDFDVFIEGLTGPFYMSFGQTDPTTLDYVERN
jgi:sugar lactone lactonase YvrE